MENTDNIEVSENDSNKKDNKVKRKLKVAEIVYLVVCFLIDISFTGIFILGTLGCFLFMDYEMLGFFLLWLVTGLAWLGGTITCLIRMRRNKKGAIVTATLFKLSVFMILMSVAFLTDSSMGTDRMYAFWVFLIIGVLIFVGFMAYLKHADELMVPQPGLKSLVDSYVFAYDASDCFENAAHEYLSIQEASMEQAGLTFNRQIEDLSEMEKIKVSEYSTMPVIYFFQWLLAHDHMTEEFCERHGEAIKDVVNGTISPIGFLLNDCKGKFSYLDIKKESRGFVYFYYASFYTVRCHTLSGVALFYDYYDQVVAKEKQYHCVEYSFSTYETIAEIIDQRYENYQNRYSVNLEDDEEERSGAKVTWELMQTPIEVVTVGTISQEEIDQAVEMLNQLSEKQLIRLDRLLNDQWGYEETPIQFRKDMRPEEIYIYHGKEGDTVFFVTGGADFEEEHGVSFMVRNGLIITVGYSYDFEDPYEEKCDRIYTALKNSLTFDPEKIVTQEQIEESVEKGELVPVSVDIPFMEKTSENSEGNVAYLPPFAAELFCQHVRRIVILAEFGMVKTTQIKVLTDGDSLIPTMIYFHGTKDEKQYSYLDHVYVWGS